MTKTQLKKEILNEFDFLTPKDLMKIFEMIFGQGEIKINEVNWKE